jgi:hypothetical protein
MAMHGRCPPEAAATLKLPPATCVAIQGHGPGLLAARRPDGRVDTFAGHTIVRTVDDMLDFGHLNQIPGLPDPPLAFIAWKVAGNTQVEIIGEPVEWKCPSPSDEPPPLPSGGMEASVQAVLDAMARHTEDGESRLQHLSIGRGPACGKERAIGLVVHLRSSGTPSRFPTRTPGPSSRGRNFRRRSTSTRRRTPTRPRGPPHPPANLSPRATHGPDHIPPTMGSFLFAICRRD